MPVVEAVLMPEIVTTLELMVVPANQPPVHWNKPSGKSSVRLGLVESVPLFNETVPAPLPLISPAQVGLLPPVKSSTAPEATLNVPSVLVPPAAKLNVPLSTSMVPLLFRKETPIVEVPLPPRLHNRPWLPK